MKHWAGKQLAVTVIALLGGAQFLDGTRVPLVAGESFCGRSLSALPGARSDDESECEARFEAIREEFESQKKKPAEERIATILEFSRASCEKTVQFLAALYAREDNPGIQMTITRALARMATKDAMEAIIGAGLPVLIKDGFARQVLGEALESRLEPEAEKWVIKWFQTSARRNAELRKDTRLWMRMIRAISHFKSKDRIRALTREVRLEKTPEILVAILESLGEIVDPKIATVARGRGLLRHKSPEVQVAAYTCLFQQSPEKNKTKFRGGLRSRHWQIRLICLRMLSRLGDKQILKHAVKFLNDPENRVQLTAIQVLLDLGSKRTIPPLIKKLETSTGRTLEDVADALARLTGRDFGPAAVQWESWWTQFKDKPGDYIKLPAEEYSRLKEASGKSQTLLYYGLRILADNVSFVVDTSESMAKLYVPKEEREKEGQGKTVVNDPDDPDGLNGPKRRQRIEVARAELLTVVKGLKDGKKFDVVSFDSVIKDFVQDALGKVPERLERMMPSVRKKAEIFVESTVPAGQTYLLRALKTAFSYPDVEVIYLLSDGAPTPESGTMEDILSYARRENRLRNVKINTIGFHLDEREKRFLLELADENFGVFVER